MSWPVHHLGDALARARSTSRQVTWSPILGFATSATVPGVVRPWPVSRLRGGDRHVTLARAATPGASVSSCSEESDL